MARRRKAVEVFAHAGHIHWEVRWVVPDGSSYRIIAHDCEYDLNEALRIRDKVKAAGRRMVTLRSCNVGFPPPEKYQPGWIVKTKKVRIKKGRNKGKLRKKKVDVFIEPMGKLNRKGTFWCPYCRELRKFQYQPGSYTFEGQYMEYAGIFCPICGISHNDFHVRKWNPVAARLYDMSDAQIRKFARTL